MNDDPTNARTYEARAERARQRLADNLREMTSVGGEMLRRTRRKGLGVVLGLGAIGILVLAVSRLRARARKNPLQSMQRYLRKEPSFVAQALRSVVLSMLSVLASRVARQLPLPQAGSKPAE